MILSGSAIEVKATLSVGTYLNYGQLSRHFQSISEYCKISIHWVTEINNWNIWSHLVGSTKISWKKITLMNPNGEEERNEQQEWMGIEA